MPATIKVQAGYGRLYVSGPHADVVRNLPGAVLNERRNAYELSLTLETFGKIKNATRLTGRELARRCTDDVMEWARAARASEDRVKEFHDLLRDGWRAEFPWIDTRAGTYAPDGAQPHEVEIDRDGRRVWKHRQPFEHQRVMASAANVLDGVAFLAQMGTGKTRAALEAISARVRDERIDVAIVVCPKRVIGGWCRQAREFTPNLRPVRLEGPIAHRKRLIAAAERGHLLVVNFEVLHKLRGTIEQLSGSKRIMFVPDEAHKLKNPTAKRSKAAMQIARKCVARLIMTGTPILQGIQDIWSQWYVIDLGVTFGANFVQYRREFIVENPYTHERRPRGGALEEVGLRMRKRGLRYRKEDCLDLPPKIWEVESVEMTPDQRRAYDQMRDDLVSRLREDTEATASTQLVMILRLSQITSGFLPIEGPDGLPTGELHRFQPNPKLDALEELVRENIRDEQIIIWARYREDYRAITERLNDLRPVEISGRVTQAQGEEAERLFQSGERRLLIGNPQAAGVGIDLYAGSLVPYYSQDYSLENREQSEDRSHRSGSERHEHVTYVDLACEGTVDEIVRAALAAKRDTAEVVVDLREHLGI